MIIAVGLLAVALVTIVNLALYQYGHGALRSAADQAARAGARASAGPGACEHRAQQGTDALLGGSLTDGTNIRCVDDGEQVTVTITATFHGLIYLVPDRTVTVTANAWKEHAP